MATNPMQRQAKTSFLLGMIVTLLITGAIIALLFMQLKKLNDQIKAEQAQIKSVYVLNKDIKSGQTITADMFSLQQVKSTGVPIDATSDINTLMSTYSLCDKAGNNIYTDADGSLYMMNGGNKEKVNLDPATNNYYIEGANGTRNYIDTAQKALIAKVDMKANTVITSSLITRADDLDTDDVRRQEYNMVVLPVDLVSGEYIDIRLQLPNGQDYIVVSKKEVTIPIFAGEYLSDTIQIKMGEDETLSMSNAIVEAYKVEGSKLYATKYTEAGSQSTAIPTYVVNGDVARLIDSDPNIVEKARAALSARYNANNGGLKTLREQYINNAISAYGKEDQYAEKVEEDITSTMESRQRYLQSLTGGTTTEQ